MKTKTYQVKVDRHHSALLWAGGEVFGEQTYIGVPPSSNFCTGVPCLKRELIEKISSLSNDDRIFGGLIAVQDIINYLAKK